MVSESVIILCSVMSPGSFWAIQIFDVAFGGVSLNGTDLLRRYGRVTVSFFHEEALRPISPKGVATVLIPHNIREEFLALQRWIPYIPRATPCQEPHTRHAQTVPDSCPESSGSHTLHCIGHPSISVANVVGLGNAKLTSHIKQITRHILLMWKTFRTHVTAKLLLLFYFNIFQLIGMDIIFGKLSFLILFVRFAVDSSHFSEIVNTTMRW